MFDVMNVNPEPAFCQTHLGLRRMHHLLRMISRRWGARRRRALWNLAATTDFVFPNRSDFIYSSVSQWRASPPRDRRYRP